MAGTGKLIIVGSGIKAVGQFTLEAQAHIREADIVLYAAADPVTDMWIERQNANCFDLYQYYSNDKNRIITYIQMAERILDEVRSGKYVCAIFYGHPGVFVTPSHNAIEIARREGYEAEMLPGISAEDCLYADLGVDPSIPGLQIFEATDLLIRKRTIDTSMNLILFQVGCVGDIGFKFQGYDNKNFQLLVEYLARFYGLDQELTNYVASMFTMADPTIRKCRIRDLRDPEVAKSVTGISTFFIPAARSVECDVQTAALLGLKVGSSRTTPLVCDRPDYPKMSALARSHNHNHVLPDGYKFSRASQGLYETLYDLALNAKAQRQFRQDPKGYLKSRQGLTDVERRQLEMRHLGVIRMLFKADPKNEAARFVEDAMKSAYLADCYRAKQQVERAAFSRGEVDLSEYHARMEKWLVEQGYATSPGLITRAVQTVRVIRADSQERADFLDNQLVTK